MKKLLFLFMLLLSLCACSSDDGDTEVRNVFYIDGKEYPISKVSYNKWRIYIYSGKTRLQVYNLDIELGKKCYLSAYDMPEVTLCDVKETGAIENIHLGIEPEEMDKSSYVLVKENEEDNRTYVEVFVNSKDHKVNAKYLGTVDKNQ